MINELFILGNSLLFIASFPMLYTVWKDHKVLRGYNPVGATITLSALLVFWGAYVMMNNWMSILINIPTVVLWSIASVSSIKTRMRKVN